MNELNDIYEKLGKMEGVQTLMLEEMRAGFTRINGRIDKNDGRINSLEVWQNVQTGKFAIISIIAGVVFGVVGSFIKDKML